MVLAGMHSFEEIDDIETRNQFIESIFAIVQPKAYEKYRKKEDLRQKEEGVDEVIYHGEEDWSKIMEDFAAVGFDNVDVFGEGIKKLGTLDQGLKDLRDAAKR